MKSMKKSKRTPQSVLAQRSRLISMLSLLAALAVLASAGTYAWLSTNRNLDSNGMQMEIDSTANLVISRSNEDVKSSNIASINGGSPFAVTFTDSGTKYAPSTHEFNDINAYSSGLKYITNTALVGMSSGLFTGGEATYADAKNSENAGGRQYYHDFTVYVASHGKELNDVTLTAKISSALKGSAPIENGSLMATSIDFYVGSDTPENYKGTLNVAGYDAQKNDYTTRKTAVTLVSNDKIPLNTSSGYLTVIMRCYFDGALRSAENQAYINSATLDTSAVTLGVSLTATTNP